MLPEFMDKPSQSALRTRPEKGDSRGGDGGGDREAPNWVPETHWAQGDWSWAPTRPQGPSPGKSTNHLFGSCGI